MRVTLALMLSLGCLILCGCESEGLWEEAPMAGGGEAAGTAAKIKTPQNNPPPAEPVPAQVTRSEPPAEQEPGMEHIQKMRFKVDPKWQRDEDISESIASYTLQDESGETIASISVLALWNYFFSLEVAARDVYFDLLAEKPDTSELVLDGQPAYLVRRDGPWPLLPKACVLVQYSNRDYQIEFTTHRKYDISPDVETFISSVKFD